MHPGFFCAGTEVHFSECSGGTGETVDMAMKVGDRRRGPIVIFGIFEGNADCVETGRDRRRKFARQFRKGIV